MASKAVWLKSRVEALEKVAEQSRLEAGAAKEVACEVATMMAKWKRTESRGNRRK